MRRPVIAAFCALTLAFSNIAHARSTPQRLWTLPVGCYLEGLTERPGGRIAVYWRHPASKSAYQYVRYSTFAPNGRELQSGEVPGRLFGGTGITMEDWNERGQHAFLPHGDSRITRWLRLKNGSHYRVLRCVPSFEQEDLQDLRFSPDGERLYVLGTSKLWIVGAQSGRLLRTIQPRWGKKWSDENARLSPDCRTILAMRGKMALFSTRSGQLLSRFGVKVETFTGGCGETQVKVFFSQDGRWAVAWDETETWVYPAAGGPLCWHGNTPYDLLETPRGHFFLDTPYVDPHGGVTTVLRRWRDGQTGWHLKLNFTDSNFEIAPHLVFSRDNRWIYFIRDRSLWRVPMPQFSPLPSHNQKLRQQYSEHA